MIYCSNILLSQNMKSVNSMNYVVMSWWGYWKSAQSINQQLWMKMLKSCWFIWWQEESDDKWNTTGAEAKCLIYTVSTTKVNSLKEVTDIRVHPCVRWEMWVTWKYSGWILVIIRTLTPENENVTKTNCTCILYYRRVVGGVYCPLCTTWYLL